MKKPLPDDQLSHCHITDQSAVIGLQFATQQSKAQEQQLPCFQHPHQKLTSTRVRHWYAGRSRGAASQVHFTPQSRNYGFSSLMLRRLLQPQIKLVER